jgi:pSer/pThr/pTyr-binding forkhead associated (FHA) protein
MGHRGSNDGGGAGPSNEGGLDAQLDRVVPSESANAFLMVVAGEQPGRVHPLAKNTIIIGRAPNADVRLTDRSVSNEHARILNGSTGFEIEDLSSTNGTYVGPRKVMRSRLKNGDRVRIGSVEFAFLVDRESDATIALISAAAVGPARRETLALPSLRGMSQEDEGISLQEIVHKWLDAYEFLRRYALVIGFLLGAGATLGFASAFLLPAPATAFCQVKLTPSPKSNPVGGQEQWRPPDQQTDGQFFDAAETTFTSPELIKSTLKALGDPAPSMDTVLAVGSRLTFTSEGSRLYKAVYKETMFGTSRRTPVTFLASHVQNYLNNEINKMLKVYNTQATFYRTKADGLAADLKKIDAELVRFQAENSDRLPGQALQTYTSRAQMESRRTEIMAQLRRFDGELSNARRQIAVDRPMAPWREQAAASYRTSLADINRKIADAHARGFGDEHPEVQTLMNEKVSVEKLLNDQLKAPSTSLEQRASGAFAVAETTRDSLEAQVRGLRGELADIDKELARMRKVMVDLPRVEGRMQDLTRERDTTQKLYASMLQEQQKAELQLAMEKVDVSTRYEIVAPPQLEPVKKKKTLLLRTGIGLGIGILFAAIVVLLLEARRIVSETGGSASRRQGYVRP